MQSVFRTFFRRAAEGLYDVPAGEELWQLLLVLALNKVRKLAVRHRAQKRDAARTIAIDGVGDPPGDDDHVAYEALKLVVDELVAQLPAPQDRMIQLRIEGHQVAEIASITDRSKRTVERTLQLFRKQLADRIDTEH